MNHIEFAKIRQGLFEDLYEAEDNLRNFYCEVYRALEDCGLYNDVVEDYSAVTRVRILEEGPNEGALEIGLASFDYEPDEIDYTLVISDLESFLATFTWNE